MRKRINLEDQEIRAKALEIAALILGERVDTNFEGEDTYNRPHKALDYDSVLTHYIHLAKDVGRYIREGGGD
jgi:hypothetical protein